MIKWLFVLISLTFADSAKMTGIPRFIRGSPQTEVFFKDLKDSYIIPNTDSHNAILNVFMEAQKTGKPVSFRGDAKLRVILGIDTEASPLTPAPAAPAVTPAKAQFKEISN